MQLISDIYFYKCFMYNTRTYFKEFFLGQERDGVRLMRGITDKNNFSEVLRMLDMWGVLGKEIPLEP